MGKAALGLLAILAISLILLFGCTMKPEQPVVQEPSAPVVQAPQQNVSASAQCGTGNVVQRDDCFLALAYEKSDVKLCRSIYSVEKIDVCLSAFAGADLEVCKSITDSSMKNSCLAKNAERMKSEEVCDLIDNSPSRAECLKNVLPACLAILDPTGRQLCLALEKNDAGLCQTDGCLAQFAENKTDANGCGRIKSESDRYLCIASVKMSAIQCEQASQEPIQDLCLEKFAKKFNDPGACSFTTPGSDYEYQCYIYFAVERYDLEYCTKPFQEEQRDQCYSDWATQARNTSSCPKIINSLNRLACYYFAAAADRMPSLCNPIETENQRNDCYAKGITPEAGPVASDCQHVYSDEWRNKCYYKVARLTYDKAMCEPITPGPDKDSCNQLFGSS